MHVCPIAVDDSSTPFSEWCEAADRPTLLPAVGHVRFRANDTDATRAVLSALRRAGIEASSSEHIVDVPWAVVAQVLGHRLRRSSHYPPH